MDLHLWVVDKGAAFAIRGKRTGRSIFQAFDNGLENVSMESARRNDATYRLA